MNVYLSSPNLEGSVPELRQWVALHDEACRWLISLGVSHTVLPLVSLLRCSVEELQALQASFVAGCDVLLILQENPTQGYEFVEVCETEKRFYFWENEEDRGELVEWIRACEGQAKENV